MYKHPWLSAIFGIGTNTIVLFLIIFVSWTRFLSSDNQELHEESHQEDEDKEDVSPDQGEVVQEPEIEPVEEVSSGTDAAPLEDVHHQPRSSRRSCVQVLLITTLNLLVLCFLGFMVFTAYHHGVYNPSELLEVTRTEMMTLVSGEGDSILQSLLTWDDILIKLFVVKIATVIMIYLIMNTTRLME